MSDKRENSPMNYLQSLQLAEEAAGTPFSQTPMGQAIKQGINGKLQRLQITGIPATPDVIQKVAITTIHAVSHGFGLPID